MLIRYVTSSVRGALHRGSHAAVLVLLAAAAGAGVVAADFRGAIADWFLRFSALLAAGDGLLLLGADALGRHGGRSRLVDRGADLPEGLGERLGSLFHAKDQVGHLPLDALPHGVEHPHALALIFGLRVDLGIAHQ